MTDKEIRSEDLQLETHSSDAVNKASEIIGMIKPLKTNDDAFIYKVW